MRPTGTIDSKNAEYHGLGEQEYDMHKELMGQAMRYWPESLRELVSAITRDQGLCLEVIARGVSDWIKGRRVRS